MIDIHTEQFILGLIDYKDVLFLTDYLYVFPIIFRPEISNAHYTPVLITFDTNLFNYSSSTLHENHLILRYLKEK